MIRRLFVIGFLLMAIAPSIYPQPSFQNFHALWLSQLNKRGNITFQEGSVVFSLSNTGTSKIFKVGDDYVEFAPYTGLTQEHRFIPIIRLEFRGRV